MTNSPLFGDVDLEAPLAWRNGRPISRRRWLADVHALAARLPVEGSMLNFTGDRYRFAVGFGAALLRGQCNVMPPNHTPDTVTRLLALFPSTYVLVDADASPGEFDPAMLPVVRHAEVDGAADAALASTAGNDAVPRVDEDAVSAQVLTSGSTGAPLPHAKRWGLLVRNTRAGARRLAEQMGRAADAGLSGVTLVATVPAQHMYGFESTVLVALLAGAAFDAERPFYPADIAAALTRAPRPRMLVTTPFHLKTLLDSGVPLPAIDLTVCATAPLAPQLAARAEAALAAPLMEIYGCTEAGQVATRRTTAGPEWHTYDGLQLSGDGAETVVQGGHVPQPTPLADVLDVIDTQTFRLLGRSNDLINIAGKRSSLGHLNFHLNSIAGVADGAFWLPPGDEAGVGVVRPVAFIVVEQGGDVDVVRKAVSAALRTRIDAAFMPRRIVVVRALPREAGTAKLPAGVFAAWAERTLRVALDPAPATGPVRPGRVEHVAESAANAAPSDKTKSAITQLQVDARHPAFDGHFPGDPLLPGVALLAEVMESLLENDQFSALVGPRPRLATVKFLAPVRPGAHLSVRLDAARRGVRFEVREGDRVAASGQFEAAS